MQFPKRSLSILLLFIGFVANSADTLLLKGPSTAYATYCIAPSNYQVAIDPGGKLEINQILNGALAFKDTILPGRFKTGKDAIWLKLFVQNPTDKISNWYLIQGDPTVGEIAFYTPDKSGHYGYSQASGLQQPFNVRPIQMVSLAHPIMLDSGEKKTVYVQLKSDYVFMLKLVVQDSEFAFNYYLGEYYFLGFYYGMLLLMGLYNLMLFFSIRTRIYLFYVLYVIATGLVNSMNDKTLFQFFWPSYPEFNWIINIIGQAVLVLTLTLYAQSFLPIKEHFPRWHKSLFIYAFLAALVQILESSWLGFGYGIYFILSHLLLIYGLSIACLLKGFRPARFFVIGFSFVFFGMMVFYLATQEIFPANLFTVYAYNLGVIAEIIVLSSALGDRFRFVKKEQEEADKKLIEQLKENEIQLKINEELKSKVNRELEEKVKERTQLIEAQAEEIRRMNQLLKEDNTHLAQNVKQISQSKLMQEDVQFEEFLKIYPDDDSCLKLLEEQKWKNGFICRKCNNTNYSKGASPYSRKCTRCKTIETATANTILHGVKFPLNKALYLLVCTVNNTSKYTLDQISEMISLRRVTCWSFQNKVKQCIAEFESSKRGKLNWIKLMLMNPNAINNEKHSD